jgi:cobalt-zinc-cadmium resistance protein CzcA
MINENNKFYIPMLFLCYFAFGHVNGQQVIPLEKAYQMAKDNNLKLRSDAMIVKYQNALVNTAYNYSPTQINTEFGQFNSAYFDTAFGLTQSFQLPGVYTKRKESYIQQAHAAEYYLKMSDAEIRQQLDRIYLEFSFLKAKENLFNYHDSIYTSFLEKSTLRWQKGETDILEKATAAQQKMNIERQLSMIRKMQEVVMLQLGLLTNETSDIIPETEILKVLPYNIFYDSTTVYRHPSVQLALQEWQYAKAVTLAEKTGLLPGFNVGYRNVSIKGTGADNIVYERGYRFSSVQLGINIPIFTKGVHATIQSARIMEDVRLTSFYARKSEVLKQIDQIYVLYNEYMGQISNFEKEALSNAKLIKDVAQKQFNTGQINYLEYVLLINQSLAIEGEYLELLKNVNQQIIALRYLTSNN